MLTPVVAGVVCIVIGLILVYARKAGKDAERASGQKESLDAIRKADAPITAADRERVQRAFRRD